MIVLIFVLLTQLPGSNAQLPVPFEVGIVAKIGRNVFQSVADSTLDEAADRIRTLTISGERVYKGVTAQWWDVESSLVHFEPASIQMTQGENEETVKVDVGIRGSLVATGSWTAWKKVWLLGKLQASGGITARISGFSTSTVIAIGRVEGVQNGIQFVHQPEHCTLSASDLSIKFTGSKLRYLLDFVAWIFEDELMAKLRKVICDSIAEEADIIAEEFQSEIMNGNETIHMLDTVLELNSDPWVITGGTDCLVVGFMGELYGGGKEVVDATTGPFLPATTEQDRPDIEPVEQVSTSSYTTSSVRETTADKFTTPDKTSLVARQRRQALYEIPQSLVTKQRRQAAGNVDWCSTIPGSSLGVTIIVTEDMSRRTVAALHSLNLIDYTVEHNSGTTFDQFWGANQLGNITIKSPSKFQLRRVKITSLEVPRVSIDPEGIHVISNLRARMLMRKGKDLIKGQIDTVARSTVKTILGRTEGSRLHKIIPLVTVDVNVTDARLHFQPRSNREARSFDMKEHLLRSWAVAFAEEQVDKLIKEELAGLIEDELSAGFPINLPPSLEIGEAQITYHDGYVKIDLGGIAFRPSELDLQFDLD